MKKKTQMKKNLFEEKPQMKKTNVENFKEVTHDIEFMFFFTLCLVIRKTVSLLLSLLLQLG